MNSLDDFLEAEISYKEMCNDILGFINSIHIRCGEFEANQYIIKKMDQINYIIFSEDIYSDGTRGISNVISMYRNDLINTIESYALLKGVDVTKTH